MMSEDRPDQADTQAAQHMAKHSVIAETGAGVTL